MDKREAIQFLRKALDAIPNLGRLAYNNQEYPLWHNQIEDVLDEVFGRDSLEYQRFTKAHPQRSRVSTLDHSAESRWYYDQLKERETAILSIIKKYENLGIEEKPSVVAEAPINLCDAMRFHPRVVEASRDLFKDKHYSDAIFRAFTAVSTFVREKSGASLDGKALMSTVFSEEKPLIRINDLLNLGDRDEQEGFKFLFMGAQIGIRNPKAHDNIVQDDPYRTLEYLSLASLLMKRVEEGQVVRLKRQE